MNRNWVGSVILAVAPAAMLAGGVAPRSAAAQQGVASAAGSTVDPRAVEALLARPVTIDMRDVPLARAIELVAANAKVLVQYRARLVDRYGKVVTLHAKAVPLGTVLGRLLSGTTLRVAPDGATQLSIIESGDLGADSVGVVVGIATDASTKRPIAGVAVILDSGQTVKTRENGTYTLAGVRVGFHRITARRIGYRVFTTSVTVRNGATETVPLVLAPSATVLNDVVTTATGDRRRLEVGNAIATINADSVVKTTLIRNVSDLLQARIPGMIVENANGMVGAPSKIRIRGINSLVLNNDPIVIVDGIRMNAQSTAAYNQTNTGSAQFLNKLDGGGKTSAAPSRLDDIDPSTIESIDVLRGPSASSLYGTEAANGVIVIKTKRGHAGSWRLDVSGDNGWSAIPGKANDMWWGFGQVNGINSGTCVLTIGGSATVSGKTCVQDSVVNFNYENDPAMTTFGTGTSRSLSAGLSGGSDALQQFFSLRTTNDVGIIKMSDVQRRLIARIWSTPAPSWMVHPNTEQDLDGTSRTTFTVSPKASVSVSASGAYRNTLNGGSGATVPSEPGMGMSPGDTLGLLPSEAQRTRLTSLAKRGMLAGAGDYSPWSWLSMNATFGGDYTLRTDGADLRAQDCNVVLLTINSGDGAVCPSGRTTRRDEAFVKTANVGARLSFAPRPWLAARTSVGEQYNHTDFGSLQVGSNTGIGCYLAFGTTLLTPTPVCRVNVSPYLVNEARDESAKAGWFLEQSLNVFGIFATMGVRRDVSSGFGSQVNKTPPSYPKFDVSYPISEQTFFPEQSWVSSLRLRVAYGQSGNVASQTGTLNQYTLQQALYAPATTASNLVYVTQLGNPDLKPERGTEWEGGFDVSFLDNERLHAEVTMYRKYTRDAINMLALSSSYGMENASMFVNLGDVENRGIEAAVTARVLETRPLAWDVTVNYSKNTNVLVHKAPSLPSYGFGLSRNVEGYPLFSYWGSPVVSYTDANHDGILQMDEIILGAPVYMGSPSPRGEVTYANSLTFLNGLVRVNASFDQVNGMTTLRDATYILTRGAVDRTAPLAEQAAWIQAAMNNGTFLGESSFLRFNELSATYTVPVALVQRYLHGRSLGITVAARNLALWTNYAGKDPNVSTGYGNDEQWYDDGSGVPQPRGVTLRFNLGL